MAGVADMILWWSLVLMLQAGGRSLEDLRKLKRERALMKLIGREHVPDADRVGDWLRRMGDPEKGQRGLLGLGRVRDEINARILRRDGIREYTLEMDATHIEAQKREARFTDQKVKGYLPAGAGGELQQGDQMGLWNGADALRSELRQCSLLPHRGDCV